MNKKLDAKRLVLLNLPYVFAFYFVDKIASVFRLAPGTEMIEKLRRDPRDHSVLLDAVSTREFYGDQEKVLNILRRLAAQWAGSRPS